MLAVAVPMLKHLFLIATLSLSAAACGNNDIDALTKLKDEACACKDKACAEAVNKKMDDYINKMKEPSEDTAKKLERVMTEAGLCLAKQMK